MSENEPITFEYVCHVTNTQVYTVDVTNQSAVNEAVYEILALKNHVPFVPHEFTQQVCLLIHYTLPLCTYLLHHIVNQLKIAFKWSLPALVSSGHVGESGNVPFPPKFL